MAQTSRSAEIGLGQAKRLCNMKQAELFVFIGEGLPVILESARSLLVASKALAAGSPRESQILEGHAEEECAKLLILIDIVRCPDKIRAARMGAMMGWFYDHLARLIYAKAQSWRPTSVTELQTYVNSERKSHYLEGEYGEYILPNMMLYSREADLYADVCGEEDGALTWHSPRASTHNLFDWIEPYSFRTVDALATLGAFSRTGIDAMHAIWGEVEFNGDRDPYIQHELIQKFVGYLIEAGAVREDATQDHVERLYRGWQIPMYHIDFKHELVPLEKLKAEQSRILPDFY